MAKRSSSGGLLAILGRLLKVVMAALVLPLAMWLIVSALEQLDAMILSGRTAREWIVWGALGYVGVHLLLWRPTGLFRINERLFATLAAWLFGGSVAPTGEVEAGPPGARGKAAKKARGGRGDAAAEGPSSTLVAFSPYVIPLYAMLVCVSAWALAPWLDRPLIETAAVMLIGVTTAFHGLMSAEALQAQRSRMSLETYLLAVGLVFLITVLIVGACLPLVLPAFSWTQAISDGVARAGAFYAALWRQLFL
jgi:hypothetical protein